MPTACAPRANVAIALGRANQSVARRLNLCQAQNPSCSLGTRKFAAAHRNICRGSPALPAQIRPEEPPPALKRPGLCRVDESNTRGCRSEARDPDVFDQHRGPAASALNPHANLPVQHLAGNPACPYPGITR